MLSSAVLAVSGAHQLETLTTDRHPDLSEGARAPPPPRRQTAQALPNLHPRTPRTSRRQEGRLNAAKTRRETRPIEPFVSAYENGSCVGDRLEIPNQSIDGGVDGFIRRGSDGFTT